MKLRLLETMLKQISMADLISITHPGVFVNKRGKSKCPLHNDNNPSFGMKTIKGIDRWICWAGCGRGNAIDFLIASKTCVTSADAVNYLIDKELITKDCVGDKDEKKALISLVEKMRTLSKLYTRFIKFTQDRLLSADPESQLMRDYLHNRGIEDPKVILDKFYIGYFDASKVDSYKFTKKELGLLNLLDKSGKLKVEKSLCFFYERTFGEISGVKFYDINTKSRTWCGPKGADADIGFFGLTALSSDDVASNDLILLEGEFDVLVPQYKALSKYGDVFGMVCRSGSAASNPKTFDNLRQHGLSHITILPDNDKGGDIFVENSAKAAIANFMAVDVVIPSQYSKNPDIDPAELFKNLKAEEIRTCLLKDRKSISCHLADKVTLEYADLKDIDPSNRRIKGILLMVERANEYGLSDLMRDEYAGALALNIQDPFVEYGRIRRELERKTKKQKLLRIGKNGSYSVDANGYMQWIPNPDGGGLYRSITNFVINYDKVIKFPQKDEAEIEGHILLNGKKKGESFTISSSELVTPEDFLKFIGIRIPIGLKGLTEIKGALPELVSMTNSETPEFKGIDRVGYVANTRTFVTPSVIIESGNYTANTLFNVTKVDATMTGFFDAINFTLPQIKNLDCHYSKNLILDGYLNCINRTNSLLTLGHVYSSLLTPYFPKKLPPHALFFRGLAGSFKSTFAQISMGLFYKDPFDVKWPHANDTPMSVEMALSYVNNAPLLLDDVKPDRANAEKMMLIIQSLYDRQGRSRLNKNLTFRKGRSVANEALIVTGEMVPTSQLSILSRMIQLSFITKEVDNEAIENMRYNISSLRHNTPGFIRWLQTTYDSIPLEMYNFIEDSKKHQSDRTYHQVVKMLTGLYQFLSYLEDEVGMSKVRKSELMSEAKDVGLNVMEGNLGNIQSFSTDNAIIDEISALIQTKILSIHGHQQGAIEVGEVDSNGDIILQLNKLIIGMHKHSTLSRPKALLPQMMRDLVTKGICISLSGHRFQFKKEVLLGYSPGSKADDDDRNDK